MKRKDIVELRNQLEALGENIEGSLEYKFFIIKLRKRLRDEVESYQEALKEYPTITEDYMEFERKKNEVLLKYSKKDENGNPVLRTLANGAQIPVFENQEAEQEAVQKINELMNEYKETIETREKNIQMQNEFLEKEAEIDLSDITIDKKYLSDDIDFKLLETLVIHDFIKET